MLEQHGATRATRGGMNMLPHCVQTSVVDLGPRCSGLGFRKKPSCMCRRECSLKKKTTVTTTRSGSKTLLKWWSEPSVRDCGFRLAGTSVYLWGKSISGPAATPLFYPLLRPELQVTISGVWSGAVTRSHNDCHYCKPC